MSRLTRRSVLSGLGATLAAPALSTTVAASVTGGPQRVPLLGEVPAGQLHVVPDEFALWRIAIDLLVILALWALAALWMGRAGWQIYLPRRLRTG